MPHNTVRKGWQGDGADLGGRDNIIDGAWGDGRARDDGAQVQVSKHSTAEHRLSLSECKG